VAQLNFMQPACPVKRPAHVGRMVGDAFVAVVQVFAVKQEARGARSRRTATVL